MKNRAIRTAMFKAGLTQHQLADLLECSQSTVSAMLKCELSRAEQKRIVELIKGCGTDHEAS